MQECFSVIAAGCVLLAGVGFEFSYQFIFYQFSCLVKQVLKREYSKMPFSQIRLCITSD
jgi:hypothetical protein